jgi:lipid-binding SYLF domain-containing protein
MKSSLQRIARHVLALLLATCAVVAHADDTSDTVALFRNSNQSAGFFASSYGYAVFPTVGEGGFVVAGSHGTGKVYVHGIHVGDASMTAVSVGAQAGGQAYSQIIFFRNQRAFRAFTSGNFEFDAAASAVVITAAASASAGTKGANAGASGGRKDAATMGGYHKGMAVFTIVKGGAMVQAALGGQKFSYTPRPR